MRVISLFDGMSCGHTALERAGHTVTQYIASEIDKHAIKVAQKNYPNDIRLGDVRGVRLLAEANVFGHVDLLIGGSPCQGFSFAGKQLAFNDPRSALFFEFVHILRALQRTNPNIKFLLENVKMKKQHLDVITQMLGVEPVCINSALVSAQNRVRYYWCNWPVSQPADRGILLRDIIESGVVDRDKSYCIDASYFKGGDLNQYLNKSRRQLVFGDVIQINPSKESHNQQPFMQNRVYSVDGKSVALTASFAERLKVAIPLVVPEATKKGSVEIPPHCGVDLTFIKSKTRRGRKMEDKSNCLTAANYDYAWYDGFTIRKLTVVECERLQCVPDNWTGGCGVSNTQRYKMLGNGWNVETVAHIFSEMPK